MHLNINKLPLHSIILHLEATSDSCGHFLNLYINLHLEDKFDFFPIELITLICKSSTMKKHIMSGLKVFAFFYCLMLHFIAHYVDSSFIFELLCYQSASFGLLLRVEKIKGPNPKIKAESLKIKTMAKKNLIIILE